MPTGRFKSFDNCMGEGYIVPDDGGDPLFAHHANFLGYARLVVEEGRRASFEVGRGPGNRPIAVRIRLLYGPDG
jgi:CspA family cold shock protein